MESFVTAWANREEFEEICQELYSDDKKKQKHAIGRISVWKSRIPRLPVGIQNTADLVGAGLEHQQEIASGHIDGEVNHKLRNLYGLALIRFVNDITDKKKVRSKRLTTVAKELNLPEWLIKLRHDATHRQLPSLESVTSAVECSLKYLKENCWDKQFDNQNSSDKSQKNYFRRILIDYQQKKFMMLQTDDTGERTKSGMIKGLTNKFRSKESNPEILSVLLEDGYLIPNVEQLEALNINPDDLMSQNSLWLPEKLVAFWAPFLKVMHKFKLTPLLIKRLMDSLCDGKHALLYNRLVAGWLMTILFNVHQTNQLKTVKGCLYNKGCKIPWQTLIEQAIRAPQKYTLHLVLWMLNEERGSLMDSQRNHLQELISIYLSQDLIDSPFATCLSDNGTNQNENKTTFHTVDDVLKFHPSEKAIPSTVPTSWHISTDAISWGNCPLGCIPQEKLTYTSLEFHEEDGSSLKKKRKISGVNLNGQTEFRIQAGNYETFEVL